MARSQRMSGLLYNSDGHSAILSLIISGGGLILLSSNFSRGGGIAVAGRQRPLEHVNHVPAFTFPVRLAVAV